MLLLEAHGERERDEYLIGRICIEVLAIVVSGQDHSSWGFWILSSNYVFESAFAKWGFILESILFKFPLKVF